MIPKWVHLQIVGLSLAAYVIETLQTSGSSCQPPDLAKGRTNGEAHGDNWVGSFHCDPGYTLVGNHRLKCRNGAWSGQFPVCTAVGKCNPALLPDLHNGKVSAVRRSRKSAYKFSCVPGFSLIGTSLVTCLGERTWNLPFPPVCLRAGCDSAHVQQFEGGLATVSAGGALLTFSCHGGALLRGSPSIHCDGHNWNDSLPICFDGPESLAVEGPGSINGQERVKLKCTTAPSNRPSRLIWRIVDHSGVDVTEEIVKEVNQEDSWTAGGQVSSSVAIIQIKNPSTNKLSAECSVDGSRLPVSKSHQLRVHAGPDRVTVAGIGRARAGQTVRLTCTSSPSTPASTLLWRLDQGEGEVEMEADTLVENLPGGFSLSSSTISLAMSATDNLIVDCLASNPGSKDFTSYQHVVQLLRPPGTPRLRHPEDSRHVSCSARAGNPPASLTLYLDGEELEAELIEGQEEDDVTAFAKLDPTDRVQHVVCEAKNEVTSVPLRSEVFVAPAAILQTSAKTVFHPMLEPTKPPKAQAQEDKRRKVRRRQKMAPVYEVPLADMPPKDDIPEDYDYSHFEYINKKFEDTFSKSASEPEQMEYFSYDYVYYSEGSVEEDDEKEDKEVKKVDREEDRVIIVEEEGSQKASGTILGPGCFFSFIFLLLPRLL